VFGNGIRDVAVSAGVREFLPLLAHTRYWRGDPGPGRAGRPTALAALCDVLALDWTGWERRRTTGVPRATAPTDAA
jgi:hypothetical protein